MQEYYIVFSYYLNGFHLCSITLKREPSEYLGMNTTSEIKELADVCLYSLKIRDSIFNEVQNVIPITCMKLGE